MRGDKKITTYAGLFNMPNEVVSDNAVGLGMETPGSPGAAGGAEEAKTPSPKDIFVLLLSEPVTEELATVTVGDIVVESIASSVGLDEAISPPGDVGAGPTEFSLVVVTSFEGLVWVEVLSDAVGVASDAAVGNVADPASPVVVTSSAEGLVWVEVLSDAV
jgi:hypothetical protein